MPKAIGGYFELELRKGQTPYPQATAFNSARSAFRAWVLARAPRRVHLPYYICGVVEQALQGLPVELCRYELTAGLAVATPPELADDDVLLYVDYFGLRSDYVREVLAPRYGHTLIVDNSQALFTEALPGIATFYSPRKFVGVADGGWLVNGPPGLEALPGSSLPRFAALLGRLEQPAEQHYADYQANEAALGLQGVTAMSASTARLLDSIDYAQVARRRCENLTLLRQCLDELNAFHAWPSAIVPALSYPLLLDSASSASGLRKHLLEHAIYVPCYWRELIDNPATPPLERHLAECLLPLPMDQRYGAQDMQRLADAVTSYLRTP
ncbi:hypothetical protein [Pseudomonas sp. UFMG81]|uniref:hypothetical protein n=1 Tax=Pseudomonas sp. UFMG81 TaxID=2745936 RepID=UPI0018900B58|nr:hypothetical protein [Pseudomonas sp. UFMG81]